MADDKSWDRDGFHAIGYRIERGRLREEPLGRFDSWIEADRACDAFHRSHRHTEKCEIKPAYKEPKERT